jgi:hypothetical protein
MRRIHSTIVLAVLLAFGLSFSIPVEDLPETSYDESEPAPYEVSQIFTLTLMQSARLASDAERLVLPIRPSATFPPYSGQTVSNRASAIRGRSGGASLLAASLLARPPQTQD